jgi:hypothetical protein
VVAVSDFAGWYERSSGLGVSSAPRRTGGFAENLTYSYTATESTDVINIWGPYLPLLLIVIGLLGATAYLTLRGPGPTVALPLRAPLWWVPAAAALASVALGLVFVIAMLVFDPEDWWLDAGFFAGVASGGISAYLLRRTPAA